MVVKLPNRYTSKPQWYVFEFSRNTQNFVDAFKEAPVNCGLSLFRLWERVHGHTEGNIWWAPLKQPVRMKEEEEEEEEEDSLVN